MFIIWMAFLLPRATADDDDDNNNKFSITAV